MRWYLSLSGFLLLAACTGAKDNLVVVLPSPDGHVGAVAVADANGVRVLDRAYAAAGAGAGRTVANPVDVTPDEVAGIFGSAIDARPLAPQSFTLYFISDSDALTPESRTAFEQVFAEIAKRAAAEIVVTGHTDSFAPDDYNDKLSLDRAEAVKKMRVGRGIPTAAIATVGRGKRELLVATPDQTHNATNRRVVITVR